jgi:two-component system KDP operon response regulator KdpE
MDIVKILVIGDELNLLRILRRSLMSRGYDVTLALDDRDAREFASTLHPDLSILDLDFDDPSIDGVRICTQLREINRSPIMALSDRGDENIRITALNAGVDDFLQKPFGMDIFIAHVRSILRLWMTYKEGREETEQVISSSDIYIDPDKRRVKVNGASVHLTPTEFDILHYLATQEGRVVTHRELLQAVWGSQYGDEREYLRVFISQLRHKIEEDPLNPAYLITEPGVGYRFTSHSENL